MRRLYPDATADLTDADVLDAAAAPDPAVPFVRFSMVSSLDGRIALDGVSGGLGSAADHRSFELLRTAADAIVVGSSTALREGYRGEYLPPARRATRLDRGLAERPTTVVLSASASLPPQAPVLTDAPAPTLVVVAADADAAAVRALRSVTRVIEVPAGADPRLITAALAAEGLLHLHHEGGPGVLAGYLAADAVDSLCLTFSPLLAPGGTGTITGAHRDGALTRGMRLHRLDEEDSVLLAEYRRPGGAA